MMKRNIYFDNVPFIGSLFMEQILFSYENIAMVFVCVDKNKSRYLCVCDDIIDEESWLIVKIHNEDLLSILNDDITILSAFANKKVVIANRGFRNQNIKYDILEYNDISTNDLPVSDQYLEMKNSLKGYIEKIEHDIGDSNIKLSLPFCEVQGDDLNVPSVVVSSLRNLSRLELYNKLTDNNEIIEVSNNDSDHSISIEVDCREMEKELCPCIVEAASIAYAA